MGTKTESITVRRLREASPGAAFDERLVASRPVRGVPDGVLATDLLAHMLACDVGTRR